LRDCLALPASVSNVRILTKSRVRAVLVVFAAALVLFVRAGANSPAKPLNDARALDGRQIAALSLDATERNWLAWRHYAYVQRDQDRRLDSRGVVKSEDSKLSKMTLVNGDRFEQLVEHNEHPPSVEEQRVNAEDLDKRKRETPADRAVRLSTEKENSSFLRDVVSGFDFQLVGEELVGDRPAYVLHATPHPGYHASGKYGNIFSRVEAKLWVDKQDLVWIKVDGQITQSFSLGYFIARVQRGSQIHVEQTRIGGATWVPRRVEVRGSARILFLKSLDIDRILTFSDYSLVADGPTLASR
jgi:hypothetical protein